MIPAGPERDRAIAELRHEQIAHEPIPGMYVEMHAKPYSTDIATAMELWEEMKGAGYVALTTLGSGFPIYCHLHEDSTGIIYDLEAKTEADAISGDWLQWKEG